MTDLLYKHESQEIKDNCEAWYYTNPIPLSKPMESQKQERGETISLCDLADLEIMLSIASPCEIEKCSRTRYLAPSTRARLCFYPPFLSISLNIPLCNYPQEFSDGKIYY
jgi:hypothetical protein